MNPESCLESFTSLLGYQLDIQARTTDSTSIKQETQNLLLEQSLSQPSSKVTFPLLSTDSELQQQDTSKSPTELMKEKVSLERQHIKDLPKILLQNLICSFTDLLDKRLEHFANAIMTRAKRRLDEQRGLDQMKSCQDALVAQLLVTNTTSTREHSSPPSAALEHVQSTFRTLPLSKAVMKWHGRDRIIVIPLIFSAQVFIKILGCKTVEVRLTSPGTILGLFESSSLSTTNGSELKMDQAELQLDVDRLYKCMKLRCDQVVKKAFTTATALCGGDANAHGAPLNSGVRKHPALGHVA